MKKILLSFVALAAAVLGAKTTVLTGTDGATWSGAAWSDGAPVAGDTVKLVNNTGSAITLVNDMADVSLACLWTEGNAGITLTGNGITFTGGNPAFAPASGENKGYSPCITNACVLTFKNDVTVAASGCGSFEEDLTFDGTVNIADGVEFRFYRRFVTSDGKKLTFNGLVNAPNGNLDLSVNDVNQIHFNGHMNVKKVYGKSVYINYMH